MKSLDGQQILEADRCFQYVCERIAHDGVHPRKVLFGSTLENWFEGNMKVVAVTNVSGYEVPRLESEAI